MIGRGRPERPARAWEYGVAGSFADAVAVLERAETWLPGEVDRGARLPGLSPMSSETRQRYEASRGDGEA